MHELPWIKIFLSRVRQFGNDFHEWRSHEWKSLPNSLTSDKKKALFMVTNVLFYFLHTILCHEHTNPLRTIIERSFRHCCQGWPFLTEHCDVTTIDLWRHVNAKYWYCDIIFVFCHCTRKLAQRRSSLVNIDISPPGIHGLACKNMILSPVMPTVCLEQKSENFQSCNMTLSTPSSSRKYLYLR